MSLSSTAFIWNGAEFVPCDGIPVSDRGFRYGMALFESLAIRNGRVEFLDGHLARLEAACHRCGWPVDPAVLTCAGAWFEQISGPAFCRIYITAGEGGPADPITAPQVVLFVEPRELPGPQAIRLGFHSEPFFPFLGGLKTANYWANAEALRQARAAGNDEALLLTLRGILISACMANVFVELGGRWVTPHLATGARSGVVREWVIQRHGAVQSALSRKDLKRATACFLTNCWNGVVPVATLSGRPLDIALADTLRSDFFAKA